MLILLCIAGVLIIRDEFVVGQRVTARCSSDVLATRMEWLTNGVVVESANSTQQLNLLFSLVNDSIHNQVYICSVTRKVDRVTATQNFTVNVDGKMINFFESFKIYEICFLSACSHSQFVHRALRGLH